MGAAMSRTFTEPAVQEANESVQDAFLDLAVYALIGLVLWEEENEPNQLDDRAEGFR